MTTLRQAAMQALEALDTLYRTLSPESVLAADLKRRADALREALEQPEQEPEPAHGDIRALKYRIHELEGEVIGYKRMLEEAALKKLADLGQEIEQEPVAWLSRDEARLALWDAIHKREFGNPTDDKLILNALRDKGLWIGRLNASLERATLAQPDPVACLVGMKGSAFDTPETKRAYTYAEQPGNIVAYKLGMACDAAAKKSAGDSIDRGLGLLQELQKNGFGVFDLGAEYAAPPTAQPAQTDQWTGCGECDCAFSCHNGGARCIRLQPELAKRQWNRGCGVCGIGADGQAMGYVCNRSDCPTRVTYGGVA